MTDYRFTLPECRALSRRAWQLRRYHAARLVVPVMSVSWRECLILAKRESVRAQVWALHGQIVRLFPSRPAPLVGVGDPVYLPASKGRQSGGGGWRQVAMAAVAVALVLI